MMMFIRTAKPAQLLELIKINKLWGCGAGKKGKAGKDG